MGVRGGSACTCSCLLARCGRAGWCRTLDLCDTPERPTTEPSPVGKKTQHTQCHISRSFINQWINEICELISQAKAMALKVDCGEFKCLVSALGLHSVT